jgi:hypothetical protein
MKGPQQEEGFFKYLLLWDGSPLLKVYGRIYFNAPDALPAEMYALYLWITQGFSIW